MRKFAVLGLAVVCLTAIASTDIASVERRQSPNSVQPPQAHPNPMPVRVTNFPATQSVNGTVQVGNLPLDANGNVRVKAGSPSASGELHCVGVTAATFPPDSGILTLSRACNAEFAGSRICLTESVLGSLPPPPEWTGFAASVNGFGGEFTRTECMQSDGKTEGGLFTSCDFGVSEPIRVTCCGT